MANGKCRKCGQWFDECICEELHLRDQITKLEREVKARQELLESVFGSSCKQCMCSLIHPYLVKCFLRDADLPRGFARPKECPFYPFDPSNGEAM